MKHLRLVLALGFVAVGNVLHQRRRGRLTDFVFRVVKRSGQPGEDALQLLHLGVGGRAFERLGRPRDFLL